MYGREATQPIEDSKTAHDEIFVLPYESLVPASDGNNMVSCIFHVFNFTRHCFVFLLIIFIPSCKVEK